MLTFTVARYGSPCAALAGAQVDVWHCDAGGTYSDVEIAAVANYVTGRFGSEQSKITAKDVAELRNQTSR